MPAKGVWKLRAFWLSECAIPVQRADFLRFSHTISRHFERCDDAIPHARSYTYDHDTCANTTCPLPPRSYRPPCSMLPKKHRLSLTRTPPPSSQPREKVMTPKNLLRNQLKLCLITPAQGHIHDYAATIIQAIKGGVTMVQLREKGPNLSEIKEKALFLQNLVKPYSVPLIINDHVALAAEIEADGVHIGQGDVPVSEARKILGKQKIIGVSIESFDDLHRANNNPEISYVTASAVFPSTSKPDCKTIWGISHLHKLTAMSTHPMTAIGSINITNAHTVFDAGACGIAVIGAIHNAKDPYKAAQDLAASAHHFALTPTQTLGR